MPPKAARRHPSTRHTEELPEESESIPTTPVRGEATAQNTSETQQRPSSSSRAPVQRLQSLKKRTPSGSIAPSGRPSSTLGGEQAKPTLKYKPRGVGRRSKEEREAIEKLEQERRDERLKEAAAIQRGRGGSAQPASRGGGVRGRGAHVGTSVGGPLGSGTVGRRGRGGGFGSQTRRESTVGETGAIRAAATDLSDEEGDVRVSIDRINLESSDEDDEPKSIKGKAPARRRSRGLRPVRVERHEHEDRVVSVNMESSSSKSAELRRKPKEAEAAQDNAFSVEDNGDDVVVDGVPVKEEPVDEQVLPDAEPQDDGLLPAQKVRVRRKLSGKKAAEQGLPEPERELETARDPRELLRTKEEIEEYDRHQKDLELVRNLFFEPAERDKPATAAEEGIEGEGDTQLESEKLPNNNLAGQLFLMQFPPMTPNLTTPGRDQLPENMAESTATTIKPEDNEVEILENGSEPTKKRGPPKIVTAATDWALPAGRVGKFNVHRSGRVTLDWGGISFELDRAAAVDFVQEALIVSSAADEGSTETGIAPAEEEYRAWSMGKLYGKFTVTPDWDEMLA